MAPYMAEELWSRLRHGSGEPKSIHQQLWPVVDEIYLIEEKIVIPVAINGKVRDQLTVDKNTKDIVKAAKELENIKKWLVGKIIVKEIYIQNKMVNFVVKG